MDEGMKTIELEGETPPRRVTVRPTTASLLTVPVDPRTSARWYREDEPIPEVEFGQRTYRFSGRRAADGVEIWEAA